MRGKALRLVKKTLIAIFVLCILGFVLLISSPPLFLAVGYKVEPYIMSYLNRDLPLAEMVDGHTILFDGRQYTVDPHFQVRPSDLGAAVAKLPDNYRVYAINGLRSEEWLALDPDGLAFAFAYREKVVPPLTLADFQVSGIGVGLPSRYTRVITDQNVIRGVLDSLAGQTVTLGEGERSYDMRNLNLFSDRYPGLLYQLHLIRLQDGRLLITDNPYFDSQDGLLLLVDDPQHPYYHLVGDSDLREVLEDLLL
ncbi:hypothetical protein SY88_18920 [Clostridiales bacterium PH28_bin88]|nr:hypothetical protein SY88_18920 [Clostridiales bacterium PH28_bin88]